MITIENINKILQKPLGKKNFYVARIEDTIIYNPMTFSRESRYIFELSNKQYAITVTLDRGAKQFVVSHYKLTSSTGNVLYITGKEISNIDIFIDKLRFVTLG